MKSLTDKINEGFFKNVGVVRPQPKTKEELKKLIASSINSNGYNCDLNFIDTSLITDMSYLFLGDEFNGDISAWDVSKVENMSEMFACSSFNGDISKWNVSKVKDMDYMFANTKKFNCDISKWDVSNVRKARCMFAGAAAFNKDLSSWDLTRASIRNTFKNCPIKDEFKPKGV